LFVKGNAATGVVVAMGTSLVSGTDAEKRCTERLQTRDQSGTDLKATKPKSQSYQNGWNDILDFLVFQFTNRV
jgi:hypothetical protein